MVTAVAVLPFQDFANSPDSSYLGEGMTEGLTADLAEVGALKVISRSSGAVAQGMARPLRELARGLGVDAIVNGSIRRAGDTVGIHVRVLHAADSTLLLARDYHVVSASCRTCSVTFSVGFEFTSRTIPVC